MGDIDMTHIKIIVGIVLFIIAAYYSPPWSWHERSCYAKSELMNVNAKYSSLTKCMVEHTQGKWVTMATYERFSMIEAVDDE